MSAEEIAKVISDFRKGNVKRLGTKRPPQFDPMDVAEEGELRGLVEQAIHAIPRHPVVDITSVYREFVHGDKEWWLYEDSIMRPPLMTANYCYVNEHGNVTVMHAASIDMQEQPMPPEHQWESLSGTHTIDWERVRWFTIVLFWMGGRSKTLNEYIPTQGPVYHLSIPIYEDGQAADLGWKQLHENLPPEHWNGAMTSLLKALTILNCRNVEIMEPARSRSEQRRVARTGVTVTEIHITPIGKYRRNQGAKPLGSSGVPLSTVRGHIARYGPKYGRGLLFGKYEGEYWVSPHLRGAGESHEQNYSIEK